MDHLPCDGTHGSEVVFEFQRKRVSNAMGK